MGIYSLHANVEHYLTFNLPVRDLLHALKGKFPPKQILHFYKHNLSLSDGWPAVQASFVGIDSVTSRPALPDITTWLPGTMILSPHAKQLLEGVLSECQWLPVDTKDGEYWIAYSRSVITADENLSENIVNSGEIIDAGNLKFPDRLNESTQATLFKSDSDGYRQTFGNDLLKSTVEAGDLKGITFSTDLVSPAYMSV